MSDSVNKADSDRVSGATRGVSSHEEARVWLAERGIEDIECITPDLAGVARGNMMPS